MLYKSEQEKTIEDCIRTTAEKTKDHNGKASFNCVGLQCDKCPFDKDCYESGCLHTMKVWIEILQENGVTIDPAVVAEYCPPTEKPVGELYHNNDTTLTQTIYYLQQQRKYIEETIEDEQLRGNCIKYLAKASAYIMKAVGYLDHADILLRKQCGE